MLFKYPCTQCFKPCKSNQLSICCDICQVWTHLKCTSLTASEFEKLGSSAKDYFCQNCCDDIFPFSSLTNHEIIKEQLLDAVSSSSQGLDLLDFTCAK